MLTIKFQKTFKRDIKRIRKRGYDLSLMEDVVNKHFVIYSEDKERYMKPEISIKDTIIQKRIGIAKGQDLYDDDYDLDELNPVIAEMFGGEGYL